MGMYLEKSQNFALNVGAVHWNITDVAWLLLIAVFLYTGYGKVLNLKMKNGLNFEIPVNGMTEDVEQFRLLIGKE